MASAGTSRLGKNDEKNTPRLTLQKQGGKRRGKKKAAECRCYVLILSFGNMLNLLREDENQHLKVNVIKSKLRLTESHKEATNEDLFFALPSQRLQLGLRGYHFSGGQLQRLAFCQVSTSAGD